jgi:hypothetical protein
MDTRNTKMGKFIFTNGGGLSVISGPSTTSKANANLTGFLDAPDPIYGSGADGSVTLDGTTTILSMVPSSSVYTATRDLFFYNLTLSDSVRLNPAGYRIFVQNILMLGNGSVIGHTTGFATAGSIQQGGAANNATTSPVEHSLGGSSELYTAIAPTAATGGANYYYQPFQAVRGYSITGSSTSPTFLRGGAGGASGTGGGVVILAARYISLSSGTATIKAPGTSGAGGGGGGVVIVISSAATLLSGVSTDVTGGTGCNAGTSIYSRVA